MKDELGKYLIDVSKLLLGGVVLSSVLEMSINKLTVIIAGIIAAIGFLIFGLIILKEKK
jgi:membrane protein DedA with SNARE-associated domain